MLIKLIWSNQQFDRQLLYSNVNAILSKSSNLSENAHQIAIDSTGSLSCKCSKC